MKSEVVAISCAYCGDELYFKEFLNGCRTIALEHLTGSHPNCKYPWDGTVHDLEDFRKTHIPIKLNAGLKPEEK